jgi:hypothetical protein
MNARQSVTIVSLVVCAVLVAAVPAVGLGAPATHQVGTNDTGTFGQQIASFMQASAADADQSAERGMWQVRVNASTDRAGEVTDRARALEERLQRLQNRSQRLAAEYGNGVASDVAYTARASAVRAQIANLRESINRTERTAAAAGVSDARLDRLRRQAHNTTGPQVAAFARAIADPPRGPPAGMPGGPPADRGPGVGPRSDGDAWPNATRGPGVGSVDGTFGGDSPTNATRGPGRSPWTGDGGSSGTVATGGPGDRGPPPR